MTLFGILAGLAALVAHAYAQEAAASPPVEHGRSSFDQMLNKLPTSCVDEVQDEAVQICSSDCMIAVPDLALPEADSCDLRIWGCVWPEQKSSRSGTCPSGWTGGYTVERTYEVRNCGTTLVDTGDAAVTSGGCTRSYTETEQRSECGTGYTGTVTYSRTVTQELNPLTSATTVVSTTAWTAGANSCTPTTCPTPWGGTVNNGSGVTAYNRVLNGTPGPGCGGMGGGYYPDYCYSCLSETRYCNSGNLSGSYTLQSCTSATAANCTAPWGATVAHGGSVTAYQVINDRGQCGSETRTCTNGSLSGSYTLQSCTVSTPTCDWSPCSYYGLRGYLCPLSHNPNCPGWTPYQNAYGQNNWVNF